MSVNNHSAALANNFTLMRILAACLVLLGHGYRMYDGSFDPFKYVLRGETIQETALHAFFVISGYLVMQSRMQHSLRDFAINRALRIYPALVVSVIIMTWVCGDGKFLINATGLFLDNVRPVNASLWTIQIELWLYVAVGLLGKRAIFLAPAIALFRDGEYQAHALNAGYFFLGAAMVVFNMRPRLWMLAPVVLYAFMPFYMAALAALVLWLSLRAPAIPLRIPDISYGMYLYAWPIQKWLMGFDMSFAMYQATALIVAILAGYASMQLIEKPALKLKRTPTVKTSTPLFDLQRISRYFS
jgi:peptidoglycan/LPS O-acetylase OafA/YrhL